MPEILANYLKSDAKSQNIILRQNRILACFFWIKFSEVKLMTSVKEYWKQMAFLALCWSLGLQFTI